MKLKTAQKLQAQGRLTRSVLTEMGWYAPGPLKGKPAPFEEVSDDDIVVVIPAKVIAKRKGKKKAPVILKALPVKRKVVVKRAVKGKKKKHG